MTVAQQLYDLLAIDEDIDRHRQALASIESSLMDNSRLIQARQSVEKAREVLAKQETERRNLELTVDSSQEKAARVERRLYGGTVRNPRELEDLQAAMNILKGHLREQEEELLLLLEALEETQKGLGELESVLEETEAGWQREQGRLLEEKAHLHQNLALLEGRRQGLSSLVAPGHLGVYDALRSTRQGVAVVKVERGMCQGCRITLPTRVVQLARTAQAPVHCPSCNRILYVS